MAAFKSFVAGGGGGMSLVLVGVSSPLGLALAPLRSRPAARAVVSVRRVSSLSVRSALRDGVGAAGEGE